MGRAFGELQFPTVVEHVSVEGLRVPVSGQLADAFLHLREVGGAVDLAALPEDQPIVRVKPMEVEFLVRISADGLEDFLDDLRVVEEGGPEVEGVAVLFDV